MKRNDDDDEDKQVHIVFWLFVIACIAIGFVIGKMSVPQYKCSAPPKIVISGKIIDQRQVLKTTY